MMISPPEITITRANSIHPGTQKSDAVLVAPPLKAAALAEAVPDVPFGDAVIRDVVLGEEAEVRLGTPEVESSPPPGSGVPPESKVAVGFVDTARVLVRPGAELDGDAAPGAVAPVGGGAMVGGGGVEIARTVAPSR